ncbi:MAG: DNA polymerase II [Pseudomonadales bacterium]|nr:DNA polymerase II [Pseudomonadales bacterium]
MTQGFLLTRQRRENRSQKEGQQGLVFTYWIKTDEGAVCVEIDNQQAVCFVETVQLKRIEKRLLHTPGVSVKPLALSAFSGEPVSGVYFSSYRQLLAAKDEFENIGIPFLEADVRPAERYLMERFITSVVSIEGGKAVRRVSNDRFDTVCSPRLIPGSFIPQFKVASIDIETSMDIRESASHDQLYSIAVIQGLQRFIFMVGETAQDGSINENNKYEDFTLVFARNERHLLELFLIWVENADPDIIVGWNVVNFDLRMLQKKCDQYRLAFSLGRNQLVPEWRSSQREGQHYFVLVPGRVVLDGIDTLKAATYNFESFSLENVAREFLGRGKLVHDVANRGEEIGVMFRNDKVALARYNIEDCQLVLDIFDKAQLLHFAEERARLTGLPMDKTGGSVAAFENLYLPRLHRQGYVAPNIGMMQSDIVAPGGYVMNSAPGLYEHVLVLDFKSLYPSIIRTFNIDPLSLVVSQQALGENTDIPPEVFNQPAVELDASVLEKYADQDLNDWIPGFNGAFFSKHHHILPGIITTLWQARDAAKKEKNTPLSQAIKIIMNSFYGVLGTPLCRFYDPRLSSSITLRGHDILQKTRELIESQGYQVIYGDTDSVFVWVNKENEVGDVDVCRIGSELAQRLNHWWDKTLESRFGLKSCLEIEFETHFSRFMMPTVRGSDVGSKKRYAGMISASGKEDELVFKGLENVRTDWTLLARDVQRKLFWKVFHDEPYELFIKQVYEQVMCGEMDAQLVFRKRLRRKLSDYQKNVPPHVQAARKADERNVQLGKPEQFEFGGWSEYIMTLNGPEPIMYAESSLDYDFYIERQLGPAVDGILQFMGTSLQQITDQQMGLF